MRAVGSAMDEPEDLLQLVLGMNGGRLFDQLFSGAAAVPRERLDSYGKVDFEDAKIAAAKMKEVSGATVDELGQLGKRALRSDLVQDAAAGAGAVVGGASMSLVPSRS